MDCIGLLFCNCIGDDEWWLENCENHGNKNNEGECVGRGWRRNSRRDDLGYNGTFRYSGFYDSYHHRIYYWRRSLQKSIGCAMGGNDQFVMGMGVDDSCFSTLGRNYLCLCTLRFYCLMI